MVEKILETATLNHNSLVLTKQPVNIASLIEQIIEKYKQVNTSKTIHFKNKLGNIILDVDPFHFENALGNIVDNALKYGGDSIFIELNESQNKVQISISDNGNGIPKSQKEKVFEQFYRIPTGNTHNIKGFGIGLYYSRSIVESHGGTIQINYNKNNKTVFKIELPNV
jgi:two-component system phosphate regulon sensor histidine kinase PhoR